MRNTIVLKCKNGFWENVEFISEYRDMPRKELAYKAKFSINSISTGIARRSIPAADVACRIAQVLGVSVEYLVTGKQVSNLGADAEIEMAKQKSPNLLSPKYSALIFDMEKLPAKIQKSVERLVHDMADDG